MSETPKSVQESREVAAELSDVWAALATSEGLASWYGTFTGDPAEGAVELTMVEMPEHPGTVTINACVPEELVDVSLPYGDWRIRVSLAADSAGTTTVTVEQDGVAAEEHTDIAAGWQYYLRRLEQAVKGGDPDSVDWDTLRSEYGD